MIKKYLPQFYIIKSLDGYYSWMEWGDQDASNDWHKTSGEARLAARRTLGNDAAEISTGMPL